MGALIAIRKTIPMPNSEAILMDTSKWVFVDENCADAIPELIMAGIVESVAKSKNVDTADLFIIKKMSAIIMYRVKKNRGKRVASLIEKEINQEGMMIKIKIKGKYKIYPLKIKDIKRELARKKLEDKNDKN